MALEKKNAMCTHSKWYPWLCRWLIAAIPLVVIISERSLHYLWARLLVFKLGIDDNSFDWIKYGDVKLGDPELSRLFLSFELWRLTAMIYFIAGAVSLFTACRTIRKNSPIVGIPLRIGFFLAMLLLFGVVGFLCHEKMKFGFPTTAPAINAVESVLNFKDKDKDKELTAILQWANYLMYFSIVALGISLVSVMWTPPTPAASMAEVESRLEMLKSKGRSTTFLLISFSVFVTSGIVEFQSWMMMPVSWLDQEPRQTWASLASTVASMSGIKATLLFVMLFLPAYYFHESSIKALASDYSRIASNDPTTKVSLKTWKEDNDLGTTTVENLTKALAMVAPALTNPILGVWTNMV